MFIKEGAARKQTGKIFFLPILREIVLAYRFILIDISYHYCNSLTGLASE
jgi:hypothetical protein